MGQRIERVVGTRLARLAARAWEAWSRVDARVRRGAMAGAAAVVIAVVAIVLGLNLGESQPAAQADPADTYATAPDCDSVNSDVVDSVIPEATVETNKHGPLEDADSATCEWTSIDSSESAPRSLHVEYEAHFTDKAGEVSGAESASDQLRQLAPVGDLAGSTPVPSLGKDALVWPSSDDGSAAEVAFRRDNLVVRVYYGGDENASGQKLSYAAARDGAISVATKVANSL